MVRNYWLILLVGQEKKYDLILHLTPFPNIAITALEINYQPPSSSLGPVLHAQVCWFLFKVNLFGITSQLLVRIKHRKQY